MDTKHNVPTALPSYGHTTPTRPTPSYLRDYHNDDKQTQLPASRRVCPQSPKRVT